MTTPIESASPAWRIPIGALLLFGFGGLVGVAVSIALYLGIDSARENTRELLKENLETLVHDLTGQVDRHLTPVLEQARWIGRQVDAGVVDPEDSLLFDTLARGALAATPQVRHAEIHLDSGATRRISRDAPGNTEGEVPTESVGPQVTDARPDTLESTWQQPTFDPVTEEFVMRLVTPLVSKQNRLAIMIHVVPLSSIARHLNDLLDETGLTPFILYNWQWVLAHPMLIGQSWKEDDATISLPRLEGLGDGVLASIWDTDQERPTIVAPSDYFRTSLIELGEQHYAFTYRSFVGFGEAPWTIGVYRRVELEDSVLLSLIHI